MSYNSEIVQRELVKLMPASLLNNVACFTFYDHHPRDEKYVDITVCTKNAEIIEFYQRNKVSSLMLNCETIPDEIVLFRSSAGDLFYLLFTGEILFVLKSNQELQVYKTVYDVSRYEIIDSNCSGFVYVKVILKSDAVPLMYDDKFECLGEEYNFKNSLKGDTSPIILQLQTKLTEAKYNVMSKEKTLNELVNLRQRVAFSQYHKYNPNFKDIIFKNVEQVASSLKIKIQTPLVKSCNLKLIIILNILNEDTVSLEDVGILLRNSSQSLVYSTKVFIKVTIPPFWIESATQKIRPMEETAVVTVIEIEQLKSNVLSNIKFNGAICYKNQGNDYILPLNEVAISSLDTMGADFDVLSSKKYGENNMLAIISTTEKLDLILKPVISTEKDSKVLNFPQIFSTYLNMEMIFNNIVIHRISPYHILNGLMVVFQDNQFRMPTSHSVTVYARSSSQILALLHHIYDSIPLRILIEAANTDCETYNNDNRNNLKCVSKEMGMILEYLDNLRVSMTNAKDSVAPSGHHSGNIKNLLEEEKDKVGCYDVTLSGSECMIID